MVTELVANAIDHTDAPAIDLTVVAEGPTLRVEVANDRARGARARQRGPSRVLGVAGCGSWQRSAPSCACRPRTVGQWLSPSSSASGSRPARPDSSSSRSTVSLAPRRRSDPPPASSRSAAASSTARPADEMKLVPVRSMPSAAWQEYRQAAPQASERCGCRSLRRRGEGRGPFRRRAAQQP